MPISCVERKRVAASIIYYENVNVLMAVTDGLVIWVHLICASIWVGGSIFIGLILVPVLKSHTKSLEEMVGLMVKIGRRFNKVTIPAFAALVATGIYNSRAFFGDPSALFDTTYGIILLTKIILVIATIGTYVVHVKLLNADMERRIMSGQGGNIYVQSVRTKIIVLGEIIVVLSIVILLLAALLDAGI
ncbi:MAG TPA: CopD family protein [Nitrososphaera sp.]